MDLMDLRRGQTRGKDRIKGIGVLIYSGRLLAG